ncbi:uncharacterized protein LOC113203789 [Frankliniella occidentalis]|uniref:Uncharacterized protein LOC113203789 n=1 Tax=Frankliniella occidentalis TaxID=133901 RepID=A0A9C6X9Z1_FRAOC|nr:uncharacterized protein LOC113203789 [Frankliniella occidentalis]
MPVWLVLAVLRVGLSRSVPDFLATLVGLLPQYSAGTAGFLLARRTASFVSLMRHVRLLAEDVEDAVGEVRREVQEATGRCAELVRFVRRAFTVYMTSGMSMIVTQQIVAGPPAPTIGEERSHAHVLVHINETIKWMFYAVSYFALWVLLATTLLAFNGMYNVLERRMSRAHGYRQVLAAARLHHDLLSLQAELRDVTFGPMLHVLAGALVVPLINTYQVLRGVANVFSLLTFSTLPFVFGTLSLLADGIEVRSERFSLEALSGSDVLGEPLAASKLRLMMIARANGHHGRSSGGFSMRGFGPLNRPAAFSTLHRWYQYLQLLMGSS